jgi:hypothetical protein
VGYPSYPLGYRRVTSLALPRLITKIIFRLIGLCNKTSPFGFSRLCSFLHPPHSLPPSHRYLHHRQPSYCKLPILRSTYPQSNLNTTTPSRHAPLSNGYFRLWTSTICSKKCGMNCSSGAETNNHAGPAPCPKSPFSRYVVPSPQPLSSCTRTPDHLVPHRE